MSYAGLPGTMGNVPMGVLGMPLPLKRRVVAVSVSLNTLFIRIEPGTVGMAAMLSVSPVAHVCPGLTNGGKNTSAGMPPGNDTRCEHRNDLFLPGVLMLVPVGTVVSVLGALPLQPSPLAAEPIPALTQSPAVSTTAAALP